MCTSNYKLTAAVASVLLITGCQVGPKYHAPQPQVPVAFDPGPQLLPTTQPVTLPNTSTTSQPTVASTRSVAAATKAAVRKTPMPVDLAHWWTALDDPELNKLVDQAIESNLDIGIAVNRLQQARANYTAATGAQLPTVGFSAGGGGGTGSNETRNRIAQPLNAATNTKGFKEIDWAGGFDASWELDLFGRLAAEAQAAQADVGAAAEARNQVLVTVVSDLCRAYVRLRSAQLQLKIAQENVAAQQRTADLMRIAYRRGIGNQLDVVLAERQLASALSRVAPIGAEIRQAQRQIAILLGESPELLYAELDKPARIPAMSADVDPGLPMQLVRRRPDIRRAERELAASSARINVAAANLFPTLALTSGVGLEGQGLGTNPPMNQMIWGIGPVFRVPLLDFGRLDALMEVQDYRTRELLLAYRKDVINAVSEVEDALGAYAAERNRFDQLTVAVAESQRAVDLATQRFNRGLTDFLNVLDAQRQLYALEDQLAQSQQAVSTQLIALFKSLGGGWEGFTNVPMPRPPRPAIFAAGATLFDRESRK